MTHIYIMFKITSSVEFNILGL